MDPEWDKRMTFQLMELGLDWEKARVIVGMMAEERQTADRLGYMRGYNYGHADAEKNINSTDFIVTPYRESNLITTGDNHEEDDQESR